MSRSHVQRAILILSIALLIYPFADALFGEDEERASAMPNPDFDGNGVVDFDDFSLLTRRFGARRGDAGYEGRFDLNGDGVIEFRDFLIYTRYFGQVAPVPVEAIPPRQVPVGGDPLRVDVAEYFYDANGDALRYAASSDDEAIASVRVSDAVVAIVPVAAGRATVTVTAIDVAGLRATQTIAVSVTLFPRTPLARALTENAPAGEPVGDPVSVPGLDAFTYRLAGADADSFDIDAHTGQIRTRQGIAYDHERDETFSLEVVATGGDNADSIAVTISVGDVDEPPSSPPSNLSVQPGDQSLTVHFHAARDEPGKPPVLGYHAEIRTGEEGDWVNRKTIYGRTNTSAFYEDLGRAPRHHDASLQNGQRYQIRIRTWNAEGESDWAEPVSGVPAYVPPRNRTYARFEDGDTETQLELSRFTGQGGTIAVTTAALAQDIRDVVEDIFADVTAVSNFPAVPEQAGFAVSTSGTIFDITLKARLADGEEVDIGGDLRVPVEICLPVPEGISNPVIIHYKETWEMLETQRVDGDAICAHAATFSYYGVGQAFNDVPEFAISTPSLTFPENTEAGQNIGNPVTATDSDGGTLAYRLEGADADSFAIDATTGQIQTKAGVTYNYEAKSSYSVTVKVVDGQGGSATIPVTITLTDVDGEAPGKPAVPNVSVASATSLTATWTPPANTGPPITDYDVQYRLGNSGAFTDWPHGGTERTATITSLAANTSYGVHVRATNDEGTGAWSDAGNGTTSSVPTLSISSPSVTEGNSGSTTLRFTVSLSAPSGQQVTVAYADTETGTATSGTDYVAITADTLIFAAGETNKTIDVSVTSDAIDEPNETVVVQLSSPTNATIATATGTGTINDDDPKPKVTLALNPAAINENSGVTTVTATLNGASSQATTITVAAAPGANAVSGDFTLSSNKMLTIAAGQTTSTGTVTITANDNNQDEAEKSVTVSATAQNDQGITTPDNVTLRINDDDGAPTLSISSPSVTEGNSGSTTLRFTVSLSAASGQQVTVAYADTETGTAISGTDYVAVTADTLTFAAGETRDTIDVSVTGDAIDEPHETVIVELSSPTNATIATATGTGTINDDDPKPKVTLALNPAAINENNGVTTVTATLNGASSQATTIIVAAAPGANATAGDFALSSNKRLTIAAGQTTSTGTVTITANDNNQDEAEKSVTVSATAQNDQGITAPDNVTLRINDDDGAPTLSISSPSVTEGAPGTTDTLRFVVSLSAASGQQVTVNYAEIATGRTATPGVDYTALASGMLTFAASETHDTLKVAVIGDALNEPNETVVVQLSNPSNATIATATGTGTINDDDGAPTLSISSPSVMEGAPGTTDTLRFAVSLSAASGQQVTVNYAEIATGRTATPGVDYTAITSGMLTFAASETRDTLKVAVIGDALNEPNETVVVQLSNPSNATIATATGTGTINDDDGAPTLSISSPSVMEGAPGTTDTLRFAVSLSAASGQQVTVNYAEIATGRTATPGVDYTALASGMLTFAASETRDTLKVAVIGDALNEPNETVVVKLNSPTNATIATATGTGTINDDDGAPTLSISSPSVMEGAPGTTDTLRFVVSLSAASGQQVTVNYAEIATGRTATPGVDYTALASGMLTFAASETRDTLKVAVIGDALNEPNETVIVQLSSPTNATIATATGTGTINDDDGAPTLSISSPSVMEGAPGTTDTLRFAVSLSAASGQQVTVDYAEIATGRTATPGVDYTALASGTLTFAASETRDTLKVAVIGDALNEPNETVVVQLSNPSNATIATGMDTGTGTINDDDGAPTLSISSPSVMEGAPGTTDTLRFAVSLSAASGQQVTVAYADTETGTATSGTDYVAVTADTLIFAAGETNKTIDVSVTGDAIDEPNETVIVQLSSPTNATIATGMDTGTGTINDDDGAPTLSISSPSVMEGAPGTTDTLRFAVSLSAASGQQVTVDYAEIATGRTAAPGVDYTALASGTLTFAATETHDTLKVAVIGDALNEPNETVVVQLSSPTNATIATGMDTGTGTINDDDGAPTLSISSPSVMEGALGTTDTLRFVVSLSAASGQQVTVNYAEIATGRTATPGVDYTALASGMLTFAASETRDTLKVAVIGDALNEPNETVVVQLSNPSNATIATATGTGTITDDDGAPTLSISSPSVTEGALGTTDTLRFAVSLSAASGQQVTVNYAEIATGRTATPGVDYTALASGMLTFAASETRDTLKVAVIGDALNEPNETVVVQLSNPTNATIATGMDTGTGTINDDDGAPTLSISSPSVTEGAPGTTDTLRFAVSLSAASGQQVTVNYAEIATGRTATPGVDYTALASGMLTFAASETRDTLKVAVIGDALNEPNETVVVQLSNPSNATIATGMDTGTGTITDDDGAPTLSISSPSVMEGATGTTDTLRFAVSLSAASGQQVTVNYAEIATGRTATPGVDYTALASGMLTFAATETHDTLKVAVIGDALNEPNETVVVQLSNPSNATIATATGTGTINDDDGAPTLSISSPSVTEGAPGTTDTLRFAVSLSAASGQQVTVNYAEIATGRTATPGVDYTALASGMLTFAASETRDTLKVAVIGDALNEPNETVVVQLSSPTNATIATGMDTGTGTINDDDATPTLSISSPSVMEGAPGTTDTLRFAVSLSAASGQQVTVNYAEIATGRTATPGVDYTALASGMLTFAASETRDTLKVAVIGDALNEPNETVVVQLSNPTNATITTATGTGTITDDDPKPKVTLALNPAAINENSGVTTVTATLNGASSQATTITVAAVPGANAVSGDFTLSSNKMLTIAAGQTTSTGTVTITANDNQVNAPDKSVTVSATAQNDQGITAPDNVTLTIRNDDAVTAGICDRTQAVQAAILTKIVGQSNCATVTPTHLAAITGLLDLRHRSIAALKAEDFGGLSDLRTLRIDRNNLTTLPAGIFSDLDSLRSLRINHNQLGILPSAIFSNLSKLDRLTLNSNRLQTLPDSMFFGLSSLTRLELHNNGSDFTLTLVLERTDNADFNASGPATIAVKVAEGAPFDMSVTLSATGGTLSSATATISKGDIESGSITVTQSGMMQTAIRLGTAPTVPSSYQGIATAVGNPITLWAPGICGRTTAVSNAIVSAVNGVSDCALLTDAHLQAITGTLDLSNQSLSALRPGDFSGLSSLETLWLYDNRLSSLPDTAFASLSNLRFLSLYRNRLTRLPDALFASLDSLKILHLNDNRLTTLPDTAFAGMDSLQTLLMDNNALTALPDTAFYDLPHLQTLHLNDNLLSALPDSAFRELDSLKTLRLNDNALTALPDSAFRGLSHLKILYLNDNMLTALPDSAFRGLDSLQTLHLNDNSLRALPDSAFKGLDKLRSLHLNDNALSLLRDSAFARLSDLQSLDLASNSLSTLPRHAFKGLSDLRSLDLSDNALRALPDSAFAGLTRLNRLDLSGNAALDFILTLALERTDNASLAASGPATLKVKVAQGAPFEMSVGLSITGGALSAEKATIAKGSTESAAITVTQVGGMLATVRLGERPGVPFGYDGIQTAVDDSLVLFGTVANRAPEAMGAIGDVTVALSGSAASVNVARAFSDPDGDALTFGATASVPSLATLSAMDSLVTITPMVAGIATVTVTATDPDGSSATQTFSLTVTNSAPTVAASIPDTTALVNTPFTYAFPQNTFRDSDRDALTYTSSGGPAWLAFTPATRTFSGTPSNATGSPFAIAVEANDGKGGRVQTTFTLSVAAGICTRTAAVRTALLSAIASADTCTVVTDAHLAGIVDSLNLRGKRIASVQATDFAGLSNLTTLNLYDNDLTSLPAGVFDDLHNLRFLSLYNNDLTALSASAFDELSALRFLSLDSNRVTSLPANAFSNLPQLQTLSFSGNGLTALSAGALDSLSNLRELLLDGNALTALPAGALDSLSQLQILGLNDNALSTLRTGAFAKLSHLRVLNLKNNALTALPDGVFTGLTSLMLLDLSGNSGANFTLTLALERTDNSDRTATGPATIKVKIAYGAPFDMSVTLSATGGTLTDENAMALSRVTIPRGSAESAPITATQTGMNQTTISLGNAPAVPTGYRGITIMVGSSLVLF